MRVTLCLSCQMMMERPSRHSITIAIVPTLSHHKKKEDRSSTHFLKLHHRFLFLFSAILFIRVLCFLIHSNSHFFSFFVPILVHSLSLSLSLSLGAVERLSQLVFLLLPLHTSSYTKSARDRALLFLLFIAKRLEQLTLCPSYKTTFIEISG